MAITRVTYTAGSIKTLDSLKYGQLDSTSTQASIDLNYRPQKVMFPPRTNAAVKVYTLTHSHVLVGSG